MDFVGNVSSECYKCHSQDPNNPSWEPDNPELIRYCEICHSIRTLHTIGPHIQGHNGWKPVGFHAGGGGPDPVQYAKWGLTPYTPQVNPGYTENQQCFGCHGDSVPEWVDPSPGDDPPVIEVNADGGLIAPPAGSCGVIGQLRGLYFGSAHIEGRDVQIAPKTGPGGTCDWALKADLPIHAWTDTYIEWELPCWKYVPGNYCLRVHTENGNSNRAVFTIRSHPTLQAAEPTKGPCSTWIKLSGLGGFGTQRKQMFDSYYGVTHIVDFVASNGVFTATNYRNWKDKSIEVRVYDWFRDDVDECSINPFTGQPGMKRNFVRDRGDEDADGDIICNDSSTNVYDECAAEPLIPRCDCLAIGVYSVYVKAIYFGDDDGDGKLSCGDTIFQVETSDPVQFELANAPVINNLNPNQIVDQNVAPFPLLRIYGGRFGPSKATDDSVRIGSKEDAISGTLSLGKELTEVLWSDTLIKVRFKAPDIWRGKTKCVWVEKGGKKSNYKPLFILAPLP
jgi:hypothetical protein